MVGGFGTVPDELFKAASAITDAGGHAGGMVWRGPSGDYGHPGVQGGWAQFVEDLKAEVNKLSQRADSHGEKLRTTAVDYADTDEAAGSVFGKVGEVVGASATSGGTGAGTTGIAARLSGLDAGAAKNPNYVPGAVGGGFTGNLTPREINERFGEGPAR